VWVTTAAACGLWLLSVRRRSWHIHRSRVAALAAVYLAVVIAATLASRSRLDSVLGSYERYGGLVSLVLYLAAASLILAVYTSRPTALVEITRVVTVAAGVVSAYVLLQALGIDWVVWREPSGAIAKFHAGTMGNSDFAGGYLGLALPFAALGLWDQGRWRTCAHAVVLGTVAALVVTRSRGGLLAAVAGIVVFGFARRGGISRRARTWMVGATLVAAAAAGVTALTARFPRVSALDRTELLRSKSTSVRAREWSTAWLSFTHHPLLGTGPETYRYEFPRYRPRADGRDLGLQVADKPHNVLLEHASDTGGLGALSYMAIIGASVAFALRRLRAVPNDERPLLAAFLGGLVAYLAQGLVSIDVPPLALMGWVALAGLAVQADPGLVAVRAASAADAARSARSARAGRSPPRARRQPRTSPAPGPPFVVGGAVLAALAVAAWPAAADAAAGAAQRQRQREAAAHHWSQAVNRAPWQAAYRLDAGVFEEGQAAGSADPSSRARHLDAAERRYQDVLRLESESLFAVLGMARSETLWARSLDPARFPAADRWWSRAVRDDPNDWEVHDGRALMLNSWANFSAGDPSLRRRAVDELRATLAIKPTHVPALVNLGKLLRALGDDAGARAALDQAVRLDPANQEARALLAALSGRS
jgi:O-antigen ligase